MTCQENKHGRAGRTKLYDVENLIDARQPTRVSLPGAMYKAQSRSRFLTTQVGEFGSDADRRLAGAVRFPVEKDEQSDKDADRSVRSADQAQRRWEIWGRLPITSVSP